MAKYPIGANGRLIEIVVDGPLPDGAIAEADHPPADGRQIWQNGAWVWPLDLVRAEKSAAIDVRAGVERIKYITDIPGQELTYREKVEEVWRFQTDPAPSTVNYPLLAAEIGITGSDLGAVATVIGARYAAWRTIGALIEKRRLGLKAQIAAMTDAAAIRALDIETGW